MYLMINSQNHDASFICFSHISEIFSAYGEVWTLSKMYLKIKLVFSLQKCQVYVVLNTQNQYSSDSKNTLFLFTILYLIIIKGIFEIVFKLH